MSRNIEEPVTVTSPDAWKDSETTHPAFGQISVHRYQGGNQSLYDSDFVHNTYIGISIHKSKLMRGLSRDWHYAEVAPMIEVLLSEAQWATFVSSFGQGGGTPCTIESLNNVRIPKIPAPTPRTQQFRDEASAASEAAVAKVEQLMQMIDEAGLSKKKAQELKDVANGVRSTLRSTLPFIASQFEEHMEATTEKAKVEIHGYMNSVIARAGIEALGGTAPLKIEGDK